MRIIWLAKWLMGRSKSAGPQRTPLIILLDEGSVSERTYIRKSRWENWDILIRGLLFVSKKYFKQEKKTNQKSFWALARFHKKKVFFRINNAVWDWYRNISYKCFGLVGMHEWYLGGVKYKAAYAPNKILTAIPK